MNIVSDDGGNLIGYYVNDGRATNGAHQRSTAGTQPKHNLLPRQTIHQRRNTQNSWSCSSTKTRRRNKNWAATSSRTKPIATNLTTGNYPEGRHLSIRQSRLQHRTHDRTVGARLLQHRLASRRRLTAQKTEHRTMDHRTDTLTPFTRDFPLQNPGYGMYYYIEADRQAKSEPTTSTQANLTWVPNQLTGHDGNVPHTKSHTTASADTEQK